MDQGAFHMLHRKAVRGLVALVLVACGAVFGLPELVRAQLGDPARKGVLAPLPWDPASLAPPQDATPTRDLPLVDEGPGPGKVEPASPLPFESRNLEFKSGEGAPKMPTIVSPGLSPRPKPKAGVRDVDLEKKSADGLFGVTSPTEAKNAKAAKAAKVKFELLDDAASKKLGVTGFVFKAQRSDNGKGAAKGRVKVDVSSLAEDFGGDYMARLQLVRFRACALTTPERKECQVRTPVDSVVGASGVLEADLDVGDDGDVVSSTATFSALGNDQDSVVARPGVVATDAVAKELAAVDPKLLGRRVADASAFQSSTAVTAWLYGISSMSGSYGAAPVAGSGFGDVNPNLGGFSYSYPFELPPAPGLKPELSLTYSSQSVDSISTRNNPQPDEAGLGWQVTSAYIERQYWDCSEQSGAAPGGIGGTYDAAHNDSAVVYVGSLCLHDNVGGDLPISTIAPIVNAETGDNLSIVLNGKSSRLIRDTLLAGGVFFRLEDDPGWIVERRSGAANGDFSGHHFVVTTPNGTKYNFGHTSGAIATAPIGGVTGFPCYWTTAQACYQITNPSAPENVGAFRNRGWRWALESIVDTNQSNVLYSYTKVKHHYSLSGLQSPNSTPLSYTREMVLNRIDYGDNAAVGAPYLQVARVDLGYGHRCASNTVTCDPNGSVPPGQTLATFLADFPDVPMDLVVGCGPSPTTSCVLSGPAFFTTFRLLGVVTSTFTGGTQNFVDQYAMAYSFPAAPGSLPFHASSVPNPVKLYLNGIQRTPYTTSNTLGASLPFVDFGQGVAWLANRADLFNNTNNVSNNVPSTYLPRIGKIVDEIGGTRSMTYVQPAPCPADPGSKAAWGSNTTACSLDRTDWWSNTYGGADFFGDRYGMFNKYVVQKTVDSGPAVLNPIETTYTYQGPLAWRKPRNPWANQAKLLWSEWRGYPTASVAVGSGGVFRYANYRYFQGMNGDLNSAGAAKVVTSTDFDGLNPVSDDWWLGGTLRDSVSGLIDANGAWTRTKTKFTVQTTATLNVDTVARRILPDQVESLIPGRVSRKSYSYDAFGNQTTATEDDYADGTPERCRKTDYNINSALTVWITDRPKESTLYRGACDSAVVTGRSHVYYDTQLTDTQLTDVVPTKGLPTKVDAWANGGSTPTSSSMTYDAYGRVITMTDPVGIVTTTTYTPATRNPTLVSRAVGTYSDSTTLDPRRGLPTAQTDVRGNVTTLKYDDLGRLLEVLLPGDVVGSPTYWYNYYVSQTSPSRVQSVARAGSGSGLNYEVAVTETFLDGLGRTKQTQDWHDLNSSVVTDFTYDAAGALQNRTKPFPWASLAGTGLAAVTVDTANRYTYDILGRQLTDSFVNAGAVQWTTNTAYENEWTKVTPPFRTSPTIEQQFGQTWTASDPLGRVKEVREYTPGNGSTVAPAPTITTYTYDEIQDANTGSSIKVTDAENA
jgi:YD repeat-containing protein